MVKMSRMANNKMMQNFCPHVLPILFQYTTNIAKMAAKHPKIKVSEPIA